MARAKNAAPFRGSYVAIVTPFKNGRVDEAALRRLVDLHAEEGTSGIIACGSTGEAATLSHDESALVLETVVHAAKGRLQVIAGVGTNSTAKTLEQAKSAERAGADALLVLVPYYNKPTQEGLFRHFGEVAKASKLPQIVYNIPGRTGVNLLPATLERIAKAYPNVVATKEAAGSLDQVSEILERLPGFCVLSGDDSLTLPMISVGAMGVISVVANIAPHETAQLCKEALDGELARATELHRKLFPLVKALFIETNPIPVKTAMGRLGLCSGELRMPLCAMEAKNEAALASALAAFGLKRRSKTSTSAA